MAFLDEVAALLVEAGVGVINTTIFMSSNALLPKTGVPAFLVLIETGGTGSAKTQNNTATQRPSAQISARAASSPAARALLKAAYDALGGANGLYNVTLLGTFYLSITARQEPTDVGLDGAGRAMVAFNINAEKASS